MFFLLPSIIGNRPCEFEGCYHGVTTRGQRQCTQSKNVWVLKVPGFSQPTCVFPSITDLSCMVLEASELGWGEKEEAELEMAAKEA